MAERKKAVVLAYPYTDEAGKEHEADAQVTLLRHEANNLIARGRAREPESQTTKPKVAAGATDKSKEI